jgi:CRP-like cAMP-binding protein
MFIALRERIDRHVPLEEATWNFMSWPGSLGYIVPPNASSLAVTGFTDPGRASSALYEAQTQIHVASDTATLTTDLAYLLALYWAVSTMTTVGYGDIVPRNSYEIAYACCVIFTGSIVFGYIISNVSHIIAIEDDTDTKIKDKVSAINAYMAYRKLPPEMQKKIRTHYEYIWKRKTVYDEREILQQLPTFLRTRVALYLNQDLIRNVAFLRDLGSDCLALLVTELRPFRVSAGHWIFKQGALGREMCFLADGIVEVLGKKNKSVGRETQSASRPSALRRQSARSSIFVCSSFYFSLCCVVLCVCRQLAVLQRGSYFGEFALLSDKPTKRSASVRALAAADLFALTKASFDAVLRVYPELQEEVQAHAEARLAEAMQGNQERDYNALPTLPAHVGSVSVPSSAVAAVFGTPGGGGPVQTPYFNIPGTPLAGPAAMPTMARPNSTPQQQQQQQPRPSFVSTPRGGLFPRSAAPGSSSSLVPPSGGSGLLSVPVPSHGHHHAHHASVSSLGFNPYLSLANSRIEGESEVELRRTLLRGKEELEIIMHPERADEIVAETAAEEARLNAHMEAEQEFIHFTSAVAGVPSPAMGPAIAGGTGGGGSAGAGAAAPSTPFIATLASVSEDEGGGPPHSAAAPGPGENDLNGSTRPRAPSNLELVGPLLPLQLAGRSGDAMSGVAGVSNEAATSFLAHLSATFDAALQPLHESQLHLVQMQRGLLQHQRELDQLVAELGL